MFVRFLWTGVMNAFFREFGIIELETQLLKFPKITECSLMSFLGMSVLCATLFVLRLLISFKISSRSTWEKLRNSRVAIFLFCNYARVKPIFYDCFHLWLTGSISSYWGIPRVIMILEKILFKTDAMLLSCSTILSSSTKVILSLETTLFDNKSLTTPPKFLIIK